VTGRSATCRDCPAGPRLYARLVSDPEPRHLLGIAETRVLSSHEALARRERRFALGLTVAALALIAIGVSTSLSTLWLDPRRTDFDRRLWSHEIPAVTWTLVGLAILLLALKHRRRAQRLAEMSARIEVLSLYQALLPPTAFTLLVEIVAPRLFGPSSPTPDDMMTEPHWPVAADWLAAASGQEAGPSRRRWLRRGRSSE
jgi:hypothetical protein